MKKRLTASEEFEIMKLVLDKFLWLGTAVMLIGLYKLFAGEFSVGISWMMVGAIVLVIFMILIVKEYEVMR